MRRRVAGACSAVRFACVALLAGLMGLPGDTLASSDCCVKLRDAGFVPGGAGSLPLVLITTRNRPILDTEKIPAAVCTCGSPDGHEFDGPVMIEIRGSSSAREAAKKSFSFAVIPPGRQGRSTQEVPPPEEEPEEEEGGLPSFLGLPPGRRFNLYGPENDRTMGMRNALAMWAGRVMGRYASRTAFCEVVLVQDGKPPSTSHYWGIYLAMEKIERSKHRVDVKALRPCRLMGEDAGGEEGGKGGQGGAGGERVRGEAGRGGEVVHLPAVEWMQVHPKGDQGAKGEGLGGRGGVPKAGGWAEMLGGKGGDKQGGGAGEGNARQWLGGGGGAEKVGGHGDKKVDEGRAKGVEKGGSKEKETEDEDETEEEEGKVEKHKDGKGEGHKAEDGKERDGKEQSVKSKDGKGEEDKKGEEKKWEGKKWEDKKEVDKKGQQKKGEGSKEEEGKGEDKKGEDKKGEGKKGEEKKGEDKQGQQKKGEGADHHSGGSGSDGKDSHGHHSKDEKGNSGGKGGKEGAGGAQAPPGKGHKGEAQASPSHESDKHKGGRGTGEPSLLASGEGGQDDKRGQAKGGAGRGAERGGAAGPPAPVGLPGLEALLGEAGRNLPSRPGRGDDRSGAGKGRDQGADEGADGEWDDWEGDPAPEKGRRRLRGGVRGLLGGEGGGAAGAAGAGGAAAAVDGHNRSAVNVTEYITGGYIIRYEHGKVKPDSVSFMSPGVEPTLAPSAWGGAMQAAGPVTQARALPFILAYPALHPGHKCTGGRPLGEAQRRMVLDYVSGYMGHVEQAFVRTPHAPSDASAASSSAPTSAASAGPVGPGTPAASAAADGRWRELVDEGAFIDYMLGTEFTKNPDGYRGSVYMSKDRGAKLRMGPMWDYNEAFGLCCGFPIQGFDKAGASNGTSGGSAISPQGWRFNICDQPQRCIADPIDGMSLWYRNAWKDPAFRAAVLRRWSGLRSNTSGPLSDAAIKSQFANMTSLLEQAAVRNYKRWSSVLTSRDFNGGPAEQFRWHVGQLQAWLIAHVQWMDSALAAQASQGGVGATFTEVTLPGAKSGDVTPAGAGAGAKPTGQLPAAAKP